MRVKLYPVLSKMEIYFNDALVLYIKQKNIYTYIFLKHVINILSIKLTR